MTTLAPFKTACASIYAMRMSSSRLALRTVAQVKGTGFGAKLASTQREPLYYDQADYCLDRIDPELWRY